MKYSGRYIMVRSAARRYIRGTTMMFRIMALVTACAGSLLGLRFIFAGSSVLRQWGLDATDGSIIVCRRIGALYLGLALMFFLGRNAAPSALRSAVCLGVGSAIALLAGLGIFERWAGRVTAGIIVPIIVETVLAAGFVVAWWTGR